VRACTRRDAEFNFARITRAGCNYGESFNRPTYKRSPSFSFSLSRSLACSCAFLFRRPRCLCDCSDILLHRSLRSRDCTLRHQYAAEQRFALSRAGASWNSLSFEYGTLYNAHSNFHAIPTAGKNIRHLSLIIVMFTHPHGVIGQKSPFHRARDKIARKKELFAQGKILAAMDLVRSSLIHLVFAGNKVPSCPSGKLIIAAKSYLHALVSVPRLLSLVCFSALRCIFPSGEGWCWH